MDCSEKDRTDRGTDRLPQGTDHRPLDTDRLRRLPVIDRRLRPMTAAAEEDKKRFEKANELNTPKNASDYTEI